jgi:hypothetical protein
MNRKITRVAPAKYKNPVYQGVGKVAKINHNTALTINTNLQSMEMKVFRFPSIFVHF